MYRWLTWWFNAFPEDLHTLMHTFDNDPKQLGRRCNELANKMVEFVPTQEWIEMPDDLNGLNVCRWVRFALETRAMLPPIARSTDSPDYLKLLK